MLSTAVLCLFFVFTSHCVGLGSRANPAAEVVFGLARFTILTDYLVRLEWVPSNATPFEDSATLVFLNRDLFVPDYNTYVKGDTITIEMNEMKIAYTNDGSIFNSDNLLITFYSLGMPVVWYPGLPCTGNLNGTRRDLGGITGPVPLEPGLLSRDGWSIVDDSLTPLMLNAPNSDIPWISGTPRPDGIADWYFFGYGHSYRECLGDFAKLSRPIYMPPSSAFGIWWSEYYPFSESDVKYEIIGNYSSHDIPLNHYVLDMDWHGYTWNEDLFPDPMSFVDWMKAPPNNLQVLLNTHDDYGVDPCQSCYADFATTMGIDPATNQTVPCDFQDFTFYSNFFPMVLEPAGLDYDWTDFGGCGGQSFQQDYILLWANHVHDYFLSNQGQRPLVLSRFGGLGNHRYPIGFSGDVKIYWDSLEFETFFTPTAANVLFGYWSHDVGGFTDGMQADDESYLRWIQFATFSPIFRTHSNHIERRIWMYPSYELMREMFVLRNALHPYIYTAARYAYDTGISIVYPLYYDFPEEEMAYSFKHQYMFGSDFLISPIVSCFARNFFFIFSLLDSFLYSPVDNITKTTTKRTWFPPGSWVVNSTLEIIKGPYIMNNQEFGLQGVYVRAGAIIPMKTMNSITTEFPDPLVVVIYPGTDSRYVTVYNDAGDSLAYTYGEHSITEIAYMRRSSNVTVWLGPTNGYFEGMPKTRSYVLRLLGTDSPSSVVVDGIPIRNSHTVPGWWMEDDVLVVVLQEYAILETVTLELIS